MAPLIALAAAAALLGGCSLWSDDTSCESVEEYQDAKSAPQIAVPAGLDKPDPSTALAVPDGPQPPEPLAKSAACLQRPPNYFDRPLTAPAN